MPRRISEALGVDRAALRDSGVFDGFVDIDSKFYVDPQLVRISGVQELDNSYGRLEEHFADVLRLISASDHEDDRFWREARTRLEFHEPPHLALGYGVDTTAGSGIGRGLANRLTAAASEIIEVGIDDPVIFELVGLFERGFGSDRISDMVVRIIRPDLLDYTERVCEQLRIVTFEHEINGSAARLPHDQESDNPLLLVPSEILTPLPVAESWSDVDTVAAHNRDLRRRVNEIVGDTWLRVTRRLTKGRLKELLLNNPDLLRDLIRNYRSKTPTPYDFESDPAGELAWHDAAVRWTSEHPLRLGTYRPVSGDELLDVVRIICNQFRQLVEENQLARILYDDGNRRHERIAQLLFFGVADAYCQANNLDLSREPNAGRGPVDFKVSRGYEAKVNVEVKLTSNTHTVSGYEKQLPAYNRAEGTQYSIYMVIINDDNEHRAEQVRELRSAALEVGRRAPEVVVVDGRMRPTASQL